MDKLEPTDRKKIITMLEGLAKTASTPSGRNFILSAFGRKASRASGIGQLLFKLKPMFRYFKDSSQSKAKKALVGAGLLYFIMPVDVVHDYIPILGYVDDGIAVAFIWKMLTNELQRYEQGMTDEK